MPACSASSAIAPMFARNAASFSSADWWPPTAVLTIGIPNSAAQRTALMPCSSPSGGRQVGVRRQADRLEPVALELAAELALVGVEVDVLRPARHRRQLDGL